MTTFVLKNLRQLFDKYAVASTEHDALVKHATKIFSNFVAFSENPNFTIFPYIRATGINISQSLQMGVLIKDTSFSLHKIIRNAGIIGSAGII